MLHQEGTSPLSLIRGKYRQTQTEGHSPKESACILHKREAPCRPWKAGTEKSRPSRHGNTKKGALRPGPARPETKAGLRSGGAGRRTEGDGVTIRRHVLSRFSAVTSPPGGGRGEVKVSQSCLTLCVDSIVLRILQARILE